MTRDGAQKAHVHTHSHTLTHTSTLTYSCTNTHAHILARTHSHIHTHILMHTHLCAHTFTLTLVHTHACTLIHILTHTFAHSHTQTHSHTLIHTHTLTHTLQTYTLPHTYSCTHTLTLTQPWWPSSGQPWMLADLTHWPGPGWELRIWGHTKDTLGLRGRLHKDVPELWTLKGQTRKSSSWQEGQARGSPECREPGWGRGPHPGPPCVAGPTGPGSRGGGSGLLHPTPQARFPAQKCGSTGSTGEW